MVKRYRYGAIKPIPARKKTHKNKYAQSGSGSIPRTLVSKSGYRSTTAVTRMVSLSPLSGTSGTDDLASYSFQLSDLPNYTAFTALYDQYRIRAVKMEFIPQQAYAPVVLAGVVVNVNAPLLTTCLDLDDATTPTSAVVQAHESAMCHGTLNSSCIAKYTRWVKPAIAIENYQTGGFGGYTSKTDQWCDSASPATQHYGLKAWVACPSGSGAYVTYVMATYYLEFRMPF